MIGLKRFFLLLKELLQEHYLINYEARPISKQTEFLPPVVSQTKNGFFEGGCISRYSPLLHLSPLQYGSFPTMMTGFSPGDELKIAINLLLSEWLLAKLWMKMPATYPSRLMTCCLPFYSGLEGEASWTPACCTHSFPLSLRLTMYYLQAANMLTNI